MFRMTQQLIVLPSIAVILLFSAASPAKEIHVPYDCPTIQAAIVAAKKTDVIIVHQGNYYEHINLMGKLITVRSTNPIDPEVVYTTRIIGPESNPTVTCNTGEGPDTIIAGFTIAHQAASDYGSGMFNDHADPTVEYCRFTDNWAAEGGGMLNYYSSPTVTFCTFGDNLADGDGGGGMCNDHASPIVTSCNLVNNFTGVASFGAGMCNRYSSVTMTNCNVLSNHADSASLGGGMCNWDSEVTLINCSFAGNDSPSGSGGGMYSFLSDVTATDCSFTDNEPAELGGAACQIYGTLIMTDCTFSGNDASVGGGAMFIQNCSATLTNCAFAGDIDPTLDAIAGSAWSLNTTPPPTGACCLPYGDCMVGAEADCLAADGVYMGDGTDCETAGCPEPCPGDITGDEVVDVLDLLELLGAWGPCP